MCIFKRKGGGADGRPSAFGGGSPRGRVRVYGVFRHNPSTTNGRNPGEPPITFSSTRSGAIAAISRILYIRHHGHYEAWCRLRGLPSGFREDSWPEYAATLFTEEGAASPDDEFTVEELTYSADAVASFLRMFTECPPLLLSGDSPDELLYYISRNTAEDGSLPPHISALADADPVADRAIQSAIRTLDGSQIEGACSPDAGSPSPKNGHEA